MNLVAPGLRGTGAALTGLALAWSFPPHDLTVLAPLAVAALTLLVRGRSAWAGWAYGTVTGAFFFFPLVSWVRVVGDDAWWWLAGACAVLFGLTGLGIALVTRLPWWPVWVACVWVLVEAVRDRVPFGGFPWGRLAMSQTDTWATAWAAVGGAPLVTFATALVGALLARALLAVPWAHVTGGGRRSALIAGGCVVAAGVVVGGARLVPVPTGTDDPQVRVAVVQGSVPRTGLGVVEGERRQVLANHVAATLGLAEQVRVGAAQQPDLVVWPESSSDIDPLRDAAASAQIDRAARAIGVPILVGAVVDHPGDPTLADNVGIVWDPVTGPGERYAKRHPVPFGEYVPFRHLLLPIFGQLALVPRDFAAGSTPGVLNLGGTPVGDVICFEVAYDDVVRDAVTAGGQVLVVQTNNATYAGTGEPEQQVAMSRLRAVEHGRAVLVAATSGISAVIASDGSVVAQAPELTRDVLTATVPARTSLTLADRVGEWPERLLALAGLLAMVFVFVLALLRPGVRSGSGAPARTRVDASPADALEPPS